jgi:hypothetical protein
VQPSVLAFALAAMTFAGWTGAPLFEYLRDVFAKLAGNWPNSRIGELLPAAWLAARNAT